MVYLQDASNSAVVSRGVRSALILLQEACSYARDADSDPWDFAVEIHELRAAGAKVSDLRWLVAKGYAQHGRELTEHGDASRQFWSGKSLRFSDRTCFVLTADGGDFAERQAGADDTSPNGNGSIEATANVVTTNREPAVPVPCWDAERRELKIGQTLVKHFKWAAANQETLLAAFEEDGWPVRIDDPLPQHGEQDPKRRLHDTIKGLNRSQICSLIRFRGDGTGEGVIWDLQGTESPSQT